ncbi:MAG: phosphatase PAP2 family protein [Chitinophagaceae bacterium]|nr:phosphatase PAP2 family protein [Chitinophagaceae bacterium]MCW5905272.1 phosphatase PAP2 family protein [Chitinophagaceae bacterium]
MLKSILIIIGCFYFFTNTHAQNWEVKLLDNINPTNPTSKIWKTFSSTTYPLALAAPATMLAVGYLKKDKTIQQKGWTVAGALFINTAIVQGLKLTIDRPRPYETFPTIIYPYEYKHGKSFPSGHVSTAFATATSLTLACKKWYVVIPAYAWATSVAYSKMYLGEHYPTDVLAGAIVGAGSALLSNWLTEKYFNKKK